MPQFSPEHLAQTSLASLLIDHPLLESALLEAGIECNPDEQATLGAKLAEWANLRDQSAEGLLAQLSARIEELSTLLSSCGSLNQLEILAGRDKSGHGETVDRILLRRGDLLAIVGPTGSGKSRLLADIQWLANGDTPIPAGTQKAWDRFAGLFPAAGRPEIVLFVGIDQDESNGTDGALQVSALDDDKRYLALDVSGAVEFKELTRTMIHEYSHLLQFRPSALTPGTEDEFCDVYDGGEACPKPGSYLRLWSEAFYPEVTDGDDYPEEEADVEDRYSADEHVTDDYAATNPAEDMAETFAEWVLLNAPTGPKFVNEDPHYDAPVTGDRVVDEKLRFFDQFPELVALRTNIRDQLKLDQLAVPA